MTDPHLEAGEVLGMVLKLEEAEEYEEPEENNEVNSELIVSNLKR